MASSSPSTSLTPKRTCDITVDLYCPYHRKWVQDFIITPPMTHDEILQSIEVALGVNRFKDYQGRKIDQGIFVCDINGHRLYDSDATIFNFNNVVDGEELLIGTKHNPRVRASPKVEAVLYLEDDTGMLKESVQKSSREELRSHISNLMRKDAPLRKNIVRLVKPHTFITAKIEGLDNASEEQEKSLYPLTNSKAIIASNWHWDGPTEQFSQKVFALIAILSEATPGHSEILMDLITHFKNDRVLYSILESPEVQEKDVKDAIRRLYRSALGGVGSVWPDAAVQKKIERNDIKKAK